MLRTITFSISTGGVLAQTQSFHFARVQIGTEPSGSLQHRTRDYLTLTDAKVEAHHADVFLEKGQAWIVDERSSGTWVNGTRIIHVERIRRGDRITLGNTVLVVEELDLPDEIDLDAYPARHCSVKIIHKCAHCGQPLPVNGILEEVECGACEKTTRLGDSFWEDMIRSLERLSEELRLGVQRLPDEGVSSCSIGGTNVVWGGSEPTCPECGTRLAVVIGSTGNIECPSCHASTTTCPPPARLREAVLSIRQIIGGELAGPAEKALQAPRGEPVVLSCPNCKGTLKITRDSQRSVTCSFCGADVLLPADLWRQLHPRTASTWHILFQGPPGQVLRADAEAAKDFAEIASRQERSSGQAPLGQVLDADAEAAKDFAEIAARQEKSSGQAPPGQAEASKGLGRPTIIGIGIGIGVAVLVAIAAISFLVLR